jgi:3-deoxy-manno-octulosonate cytidylyltransferase (CMP-KDO synthetase)
VSAVLGVVPARLGSERLPRKPLHSIAGRPLIEWVWRRAQSLPTLETVVIATDSEEVVRVCRKAGADAVLTDPGHGSGTERVAEVIEMPDFAGYDVVVNVQGDEPFVTDDQVAGAVAAVRDGWDIGTVAAPVRSRDAWTDPSVVKVVRNDRGGALYFSRAAIPHVRGREPTEAELASGTCLRHIGVYAYTRDTLRRWISAPASELERLERLEQLRALEAGLRIGVAVVEHVEGGIDTLEDARRAERRLREGGTN